MNRISNTMSAAARRTINGVVGLAGLAIASSTFLAATASAQVTLDWVAQSGGLALAVDSAGSVSTSYGVQNPGGDIFVTKHDAEGNLLWQVSFDQTDSTKWELPTWMATDSEDNILVSGRRYSGISNPVSAASVLMKFSPSGELIWRKVFESDFDGSSTRRCLVDADDNIYVLGIGSGPPGFVTKVKKFAPDGSTVWNYFNAAGIGAPINFKLTPDNHILIVGRGTVGSINGFAKITLDGQEVWSIAGINSLTVGDAAGDAFGNTYLVNGKYVANPSQSLIRKVGPGGVQIWEKEHTITGMRIEVGTDQRPVVCGMPNSGSFGAAFLKTDENGSLLWANLDADGPLGLLLHAQMLMDEENSAYLAAGTLFEMAVCKVRADGSSAWTQTMPGGYANAMAFSDDQSALYVVGGITTARLLNDLQQVLGDLNGDGTVDAADLGILLGAWGSAGGAADLNDDGIVDAADLGILLGSWTV